MKTTRLKSERRNDYETWRKIGSSKRSLFEESEEMPEISDIFFNNHLLSILSAEYSKERKSNGIDLVLLMVNAQSMPILQKLEAKSSSIHFHFRLEYQRLRGKDVQSVPFQIFLIKGDAFENISGSMIQSNILSS